METNETKTEIQEMGYMDSTNVMMVSSPYKNIIKDNGSIKKPSLDTIHKVTIDGTAFYNSFEAIKKLKTESLFIELEDNKLILSTDSDLLKSRFDIGVFEPSEIEGIKVKSKFSIDYIKAFFKNFSKSSFDRDLVIGVGDCYPLEFHIGNEWFILAPRVGKC